MNTSTITDAFSDRLPSPSAAASSISSTFDDVAHRIPDIIPDIDVPDLSRTARRSRRAVARVVPGMSTSRLDVVRSQATKRRLLVVVAVVAVIAVLAVRRRSAASPSEQRRDDWMTTPGGDSQHADHRREPATTGV